MYVSSRVTNTALPKRTDVNYLLHCDEWAHLCHYSGVFVIRGVSILTLQLFVTQITGWLLLPYLLAVVV